MLEYLFSFLSGIGVKTIDYTIDNKKKNPLLIFLITFFTSMLIAYNICFSSFSTLWLAVIAAQFFSKKIDHFFHYFLVSLSVFPVVLFGINFFILLDFFIFLIAAVVDEIFPIIFFNKNIRPFLKITTFSYFALSIREDYFLAIILFDISYFLTSLLTEKHSHLNK